MESLEDRRLLAAVLTDQPDYAFGSTAIFTGSGFAPGETVKLQVTHVPNTPGSDDDPQNQPWLVVDGGAGDLDGVADGNIRASWLVDDPDAIGASYVLTATGLSSGEVATTLFTDTAAVTAGTGGTLIPTHYAANGSAPQWTTLGNIVIAEGANGDMPANQTGTTIILTAPTGWSFNAGVGTVTFAAAKDITAASMVVTSSTLTITVTNKATAGAKDTLTISGVQVQAADGAALSNAGSIFRTAANPGTFPAITGITNGTTNFGSLSQAVTVSNVTSTAADGTYTTGALIPITCSFGGNVTVTGTPQLVLSSGATVNYSGGSGTNTLTFNYTVAAGNDASDLEATSLKLNSGTIKDSSGGNAVLTLPAAGAAGSLSANKDIVIDAFSAAPSKPDMTNASDSGKSATDNITNIATPTFTGTAEAGATVVLYDGSTQIGSGIATGGNYSITVSALADGTHSLTAKATDLMGNISAASPALSVTIDTIAPAAPTVPDMTNASDLGTSNTDNLTSDTTPTFSGTAEASSTVSIYDGATIVGTDTGSSYSATVSALSGGVHSITATATDVAGNVSPSSGALLITIDDVKPTVVSIVRNSANPIDASTVSFIATFSEIVTGVGSPDFALAVSGITGASIASVVDNGDQMHYTITVNTGTGNGTLGLNKTGTGIDDTAGNAIATGTVTGEVYTIMKTAPTVSSINRVSATPTNAATLDFTVTFSTSVTGVDVGDFAVPVTGSVTGAFVAGIAAVSDSVYTLTVSTGTGDGTIGLNLNASGTGIQDSLGHAIATGFTGQTYTIDKTAPAAPSALDLTTASDTGASTTDNITKDNTPTFSLTAEAASTVRLYANGIQVGSATAGTNITTSTLTDGVYLITATATDALGNVSSASSALSITIDTVAPTVTVDQAAGQSDPTNVSPIHFAIVFSEEVTGLTAADVTTSAPGSETKTLTGSGAIYDLAVSNMTSGAVTASLAKDKATDIAGNNSLASTSTDNSVTYDSVVPTVTVTGPASPNRSAPFTFTLTFSEAVTGLTTDGIALTNGTVDSLSGSGTSYALVVSPGGQGAVTCQVKAGAAQDVATNGNSASNILSVTYDSVAPLKPATPVLAAASDTGAANNDLLTKDTTPTITGVAGSTEGSSTLSIYDGVTLLGTKAAAANGSWTYTTPTLTTQGAHTITVTATDAAGNVSVASDPLVFTLDTVSPSVVISPPGVSADVSPILFTITFSETMAGSTLTAGDFTVVNGTAGALSPTGDNSTYTLAVTPTATGTVSLSLLANKATDIAGNNNTLSNTASVTFADSTAPTTAASLSPAGANGWYPNNVQVTLSASDGTGIGVASTNYQLDGGMLQTYSGPFTVSGDGAHTLSYYSTDRAVNAEVPHTITFGIDATAPNVHINSPDPSNAIGWPMTLTGTASDLGAGLATVTVTTKAADGVVLDSGLATIAGGTWSYVYTPTAAGIQSVVATATDYLGNSAVSLPASLDVQNVASTALAVTPASGTYGGTVFLQATLTTLSSPMAGQTVNFSLNGNNIGSAVTDGNGVAMLSSASLAGIRAGVYTSGVIATFAGDGAHQSSTGTADLTVNKAALTVTTDAQTRIYGQPNPPLTGWISGIQNGDNITAAYQTSATAASPVGPYAITAMLSDPDAKLSNYTVTNSGNTMTIGKAALTVTTDAQSRLYGQANPPLTGWIGGVKNGDNITATYSTTATPASIVATYAIKATLTDPDGKLGNYTVTNDGNTLTISKAALTVTTNAQNRLYGQANPSLGGSIIGIQNGDSITATYQTTATPASNVGTYAITATLADPDGKLGNYTVTNDGNTLTIGKAALSVTTNAQSRSYGQPNPALTGSISGIQNGDNITATYSTIAAAASAVGAYPITAALADPDGRLSNYTVTNAGNTLTIGKAALTVTTSAQSRLYGQPNPTLTGSISGIQNGDNITVTYSTSATSGSAVGPYAITAILTDPDGKLGNYAVTNNGNTLAIGKATLAVTTDSQSRVYGQPNPSFTGSISGIQNGDNITVAYGTVATAASPVGTYKISPALVDPDGRLSNYIVASSDSTLTITKASLAVVTDSKSRPYGQTNPSFTGSISGIKNSDNITATYGSSATPGSDVGTYAITATLADPDGKLGNYAVTNSGNTLTIGKATLTVTTDAQTRVYGDANPTLTGTLSGAYVNDSITISYSTTASAGSNAGTYAITPTLADPNGRLFNYVVSIGGNSLTVTKAPLTVTTDSYTRIYGAANPTLTGSIVGIKNADNITATYATLAIPASNVGAYAISATLADPDGRLGNYSVTNNVGMLTITKAPLSVTTDAKSKIYGQFNPTLTGSIAGIQNGDSITASYGTAATQFTDAGTYAITATLADPGGKLANYTVTNDGSVLTINKADQIITWTKPAAINYGTALSATQLNATVVGVAGGTAPGALSYLPAAGTVIDAGDPTLTVTAAATNNYNATIARVTIHVNQAPLTVQMNDAQRFYGAPDPVFTGTITGLLNGDVITPTYTTTATRSSDVGPYPISATLSGAKLGNYKVTYLTGTLRVTPTSATVTITSSQNPVLLGTPVTFTATVSLGDPSFAVSGGSVQFRDGNMMVTIGSAPLVNGVASLTTSTLLTGYHDILATYSSSNITTSAGGMSTSQIVTTGPSVTSLVINDGAQQRSSVTSITVTFSHAITVRAADISLLVLQGSAQNPVGSYVTPTTVQTSDSLTYRLTFGAGGLKDGVYQFSILPTAVDSSGQPAVGFVQKFHQLTGDLNGDGKIDGLDMAQMMAAFGSVTGSNSYMDLNGDAKINTTDYLILRASYGKRYVY